MSVLNESLNYLGESYWGIASNKEEQLKTLDKGNLYYRWGNEKGELLDYLQAFNCFRGLKLEGVPQKKKHEIYEKIFISLAQVLRLKLKKAVETFEFLCYQRPKIELRDLNFKKELNDIMVEFMDFEKNYFAELDQAKAELIEEELDDQFKNDRKELLDGAEAKIVEVEQGIQAFYQRVKTYVLDDSTQKEA
jgi:hypothetical protein